MKSKYKPVWCGLIIGSTMIVPGVSGGSMAMILGIYDRLISSISSFHKNVKENLIFLIMFAASALVGMFLCSMPIGWLLEHYNMPTLYFFIGAVLGGVPMIAKKAGVSEVSLEVVGYMLLGAICVLIISGIPTGKVSAAVQMEAGGWIWLLFIGVISASALVLPGISVSHFLLVIGIYDQLMEAMREVKISYLLPLGIGLVIGIFLITRFLEYLLNRYPRESYLIILGFIFGSVVGILPGIPVGMELIVSILMMIIGFVAIFSLSR